MALRVEKSISEAAYGFFLNITKNNEQENISENELKEIIDPVLKCVNKYFHQFTP
jgi:hypothetical protein